MFYFAKHVWPMLCLVVAVGVTSDAYAFKLKTHVWIAQQVINDLQDDGYLTFDYNDGSAPKVIKVDDNLVRAILDNAEYFRMGNIGPDAVPDVYTGQMLVHPGIKGYWQTDDWLNYLLESRNTYLMDPSLATECNAERDCKNPIDAGEQNGAQKAFIYGFLGHAASDTMAHTYVNHYSGNIFVLADGVEEEERHWELEKFIDQFAPPMLDAYGNNLGEPHLLVKTPADFVKNRLVFNDEVAEQNKNGGAGHLYLAHELRKELIGAFEEELTKVDMLAVQIAVWYVTSYYTGNGQWISDEDAAAIAEMNQAIHEFVQEHDNDEEIQRIANKVATVFDQFVETWPSLEQELDNVAVDVLNASQDLSQTSLELIAKTAELANTAAEVSYEVSEEVCDWLDPFHLFCETVTNTLWKTNPAYTALQETIAALEQQQELQQEVLNKALETKQQLTQTLTDIMLSVSGIQRELFNATLDTIQLATKDLNLIRSLRDNWVRDIEEGMKQLILANEKVMKSSMTDNFDLEPLNEWWSVWYSPITGGVPSPITKGIINVEHYIADIQAAVNRFEDYMMTLTPITNEILQLRTHIEEEIQDEAEQFAIELADELFGIDTQRILDLFEQPPSDQRLDYVFSQDLFPGSAEKGLIRYQDISQRVRTEMNITGGHFDPQAYAVVRNAILLAKMTLLDAAGLNQLAGSDLYFVGDNVLVGAIRSIDGNHQWMRTAPPYPRRAGFTDLGWPSKRVYGYSSNESKGGFKLWADCKARDNVFRRMFSGPMVPGVETPEAFGLLPVLQSSYPYKVTGDNPFPSGIWNMDCDSIGVLVPVWALLN